MFPRFAHDIVRTRRPANRHARLAVEGLEGRVLLTVGAAAKAAAQVHVLEGTGKVVYKKPVSDPALKAALQGVADAHGWTITVHSGDRTNVPKGGSKTSHHLQDRGADFHVKGVSDAVVFEELRARPELANDYQVIQHGKFTKTGGTHVHVGRFGDGRASEFKVEGLTKKGRGRYTPVGRIDSAPAPAPDPEPIRPTGPAPGFAPSLPGEFDDFPSLEELLALEPGELLDLVDEFGNDYGGFEFVDDDFLNDPLDSFKGLIYDVLGNLAGITSFFDPDGAGPDPGQLDYSFNKPTPDWSVPYYIYTAPPATPYSSPLATFNLGGGGSGGTASSGTLLTTPARPTAPQGSAKKYAPFYFYKSSSSDQDIFSFSTYAEATAKANRHVAAWNNAFKGDIVRFEIRAVDY